MMQVQANKCAGRCGVDVRAALVALLCVLCVAAGLKAGRGGGAGAHERSAMDMALGATPALAQGVVSEVGGLTVLTADATNEDLLLVLDGRNEELFVYRTQNNESVQLLQRYPVSQLFVDARARSLGGP